MVGGLRSGYAKRRGKMRKSLVISYGKYGGVYFHRGYTTRLCLGWMAITYIPDDIDDLFERLLLRELSEEDKAWIKKLQDSRKKGK